MNQRKNMNMPKSKPNWIRNRVTENVLIEEFTIIPEHSQQTWLGALAHAGSLPSRRRTIELRLWAIIGGLLFTGGPEVGHALKERKISRNSYAFNIFCSDHRPFGLDDSLWYRVIRCVAFLLCLVSFDQYIVAFFDSRRLNVPLVVRMLLVDFTVYTTGYLE